MRGGGRLATTCVYSSLAVLPTPSSTAPVALRRDPIQHASPAPVACDSARGPRAQLSYQGRTGAPVGDGPRGLVSDPTSQGDLMVRAAVLFVAAMVATVLAGACDAAPRRVEVGELRTETRSVG